MQSNLKSRSVRTRTAGRTGALAESQCCDKNGEEPFRLPKAAVLTVVADSAKRGSDLLI